MERVLFVLLIIPCVIYPFDLKIVSPRQAKPIITDSSTIEIEIAIDTNEFSGLYTTIFSRNDTAILNLYPVENTDSNVWKFYADISGLPKGLYSLAVWFNAYRDTQFNAVDFIDSFPLIYKFIQISDPHIGYSDNTSKYLGEVIRDINFINPNFVILTGDVAEKGNHPEWYEEAMDSLKKLQMPIYIISGNHDWYNWLYLPTNENNYLNYVNPFANYSFLFGNSYFILLDTGEDDLPSFTSNCYGLTDAQICWVKDRLDLYQVKKPGFIFMHGPFLDDENNENRYGKDKFISLCNAYSVDMVLCGHVHKNKFFDENGNRYTGDIYPIMGTKFIQTTTSGKTDYENCGYRLIRVKGDSILNYSTDENNNGVRNFATSLLLSSLNAKINMTMDSMNAYVVITNQSYETFKNARVYLSMNKDTTYNVNFGHIICSNNGYLTIEIPTVASNSVDTLEVFPSDMSGIGKLANNTVNSFCISPNPFADKCKISLERRSLTPVEGKIYSLSGREIRRFTIYQNSYIWNGKDNQNRKVAIGTYMIELDNNKNFIKKIYKIE